MKTNAEYKKDERTRKRAAGLVPREVWLHHTRLPELESMVSRLRKPVKVKETIDNDQS